MFQSILMLERLSERLAKPHEEADEKIRQLETELSHIKQEYEQLEQNQLLESRNYRTHSQYTKIRKTGTTTATCPKRNAYYSPRPRKN
jgi:hypothetical protein